MDPLFIVLFCSVAFLILWLFLKNRLIYRFNSRIAILETSKSVLENEIRNRENSIQELKLTVQNCELENKNLLHNNSSLSKDLSVMSVRYEELQKKYLEHEKHLEHLQNRFTTDFKIIANSILEKNTTEFSKKHQEKLVEILNPLKDKIRSFEDNIEKKYIDETKERSSLKREIKQLMDMNQTLNFEAQNLTKALKGNNKRQGNWGEIILENLLESSGLTKGSEYELQFSMLDNAQQRTVPDAVIRLPGDKHIIVDSKVSLLSYERFCNCEEDEMKMHLSSHIASIKGHINNLSGKNYQSSSKLNSPDFVLMFIPIESSFSIAIKTDHELFSYAWNKNVVLTSPSTLLASLRTIASVWKYEKQTKNAMKIAEEAGKMYDKFKNFVDDMSQMEKSIRSTQLSFDNAFNKLSSGRGNLISKAEKLKNMGIKTSKNISVDFPKTIAENGTMEISENAEDEGN